MATETYELLATVDLNSSATTITFSGISQSYKHLVVSVVPKGTGSQDGRLRINNDSGGNYDRVGTYASKSQVGTARVTDQGFFQMGNLSYPDSAHDTSWELTFINYSSTTTAKPIVGKLGKNDQGAETGQFAWTNTAAITQLQFYLSSGSYAAGTKASIYGIHG